MLDFLRRLFEYDKWAFDRSLSSLDASAESKAKLLLSHILLAEKIWITRLKGEDSSQIPTFQELPLAECAAMSDQIRDEYAEFLNSLSEANLDELITYKNTRNVEFQTSIKEILTHVGFHGVYHRGQIALLVRENGGEAVNTDYITFTRL